MQSIFRSKDLKNLPERQWNRDNMPEGKEGFIVEDIDMVIVNYDTEIKGDSGTILLIEKKNPLEPFNYAQKNLFSIINALLRKSDPDRKKYRGFYLVRWYDNYVTVNEKVRLSRIGGKHSEYGKWLSGEFEIDSYFKTLWDK